MATLKLPENAAPVSTVKKPLRPVDPTKRKRSATQTRPEPAVHPELAVHPESAAQKDKRVTRPQEQISETVSPASTKASQRNHRFDGKPHQRGNTTDEPHYRQAPRRGGKLRDGFEPGRKISAAENTVPVEIRQEAANAGWPRLSKRMAELGLCSRREADDWIVNGWVKVNGEIIDTLGTRIAPDAEIIVSHHAKAEQSENVTILLHKPVGYVSGQAEDGYEPAVVLVKPENQWSEDTAQKSFKRSYLKGLAPAGRLDIDSTGLLVLTQDGRIARHLIGEDSSIEKEYLVRVEGELSAQGLAMLNHGLTLDGVQLKPAKVSWQNEDQLRFVLREGRKRQIRRMCELVGLTVTGLKRVRIGSVKLGKLPVGEWRYLQVNERF